MSFRKISPPSSAAYIEPFHSKGKVTVNWSGGTAPYQLEKSADLVHWEPVDAGGNIDTTAPSIPAAAIASSNSCSQVTISWTAPTDSGRNATPVKGYYVYRDGIFLHLALAPATVTSDVGLSGSTTYTYTVRAYDGATNFSAYSTAVSSTTPACADTTPPSIPAGVSAVSSSCSQIDITWSPSTDNTGGSGLQSYSVYRNNAFCKQVLATSYFTVSAGTGCGWTATSSAGWLGLHRQRHWHCQCLLDRRRQHRHQLAHRDHHHPGPDLHRHPGRCRLHLQPFGHD